MSGVQGVKGLPGMSNPGYSGSISINESFKKDRKDIHDIIRTGQMQGVIKIGDIFFGIICDTIIDNDTFGKAAKAFMDSLTGGEGNGNNS